MLTETRTRRIVLSSNPSHPIDLNIPSTDHRIFARPWSSSLILSTLLPSILQTTASYPPKSLELGSGLGLVSLVASTLATQALATDVAPESLALISASASLNSSTSTCEIAKLNWEDADSEILSREFDFVFAADVLYMQRAVRYIAKTLGKVVRRDTVAVLVDPDRCYVEEFLEAVEELGGLEVCVVRGDVDASRLYRCEGGEDEIKEFTAAKRFNVLIVCSIGKDICELQKTIAKLFGQGSGNDSLYSS
ncbi:putative methyltransferase-domain-containing protein [Cladochytrium replicatum]|nr:putative methyltransferase-domain-containing protein [Cladochytrium replicatum]